MCPCDMSDDEFWSHLAGQIKRTMVRATEHIESYAPVPLTEERINEIVDYATRKTDDLPSEQRSN